MVFLAEDLALTVSALLHLAQKFKKITYFCKVTI